MEHLSSVMEQAATTRRSSTMEKKDTAHSTEDRRERIIRIIISQRLLLDEA
jgi:hypothetical protein